MLFPWVCSNDTNKHGNNFSYPTLTEGQNYKCYADNEPANNNGWPPVIELYSLLPKVVNGKTIIEGIKWVYNLQNKDH